MNTARTRALPAGIAGLAAIGLLLGACGSPNEQAVGQVDPAPTPSSTATPSAEPSQTDEATDNTPDPSRATEDNPYGLVFHDNGVPKKMPVRSGNPAIDDALVLGTQGFTITDDPSNATPELDGPIEIAAGDADFFNLTAEQAATMPTGQLTVTVGEPFMAGSYITTSVGPLNDQPFEGSREEALEAIYDALQGADVSDEEWIALAAEQRINRGATYKVTIPSVVLMCLGEPGDGTSDPADIQCEGLLKVIAEPPATNS